MMLHKPFSNRAAHTFTLIVGAFVVLLLDVQIPGFSQAASPSSDAAAELAEADKPIHQRVDYKIEPPDILAIEAKAEAADGQQLTQINRQFLVSHDGTVNLGSELDKVSVAGLTPTETEIRIKAGLQVCFPQARTIECRVSVQSCNRKVYYLIVQNRRVAGQVMRLPITVHDTVLRALTETQGLPNLSDRYILISRPKPGGAGVDEVLQVDWKAISADPTSLTNYSLLPGDRIFINEPASIWDFIAAVLYGRLSRPVPPPPIALKQVGYGN